LNDVEEDGTLVLESKRQGIVFIDIRHVREFHVGGPWGVF